MKTLSTPRNLTVLLAALMLSGGMTACKSKKKVPEPPKNPEGEVEVKRVARNYVSKRRVSKVRFVCVCTYVCKWRMSKM